MKKSVTTVEPEESIEEPIAPEPDVSLPPQPQGKPWILYGSIGAVTVVVGTVLAIWLFRADNRPNTFGEYAANLVIANKSIQEELKVSGEQLEKIGKLEKEYREYISSSTFKALTSSDQKIKKYQQSRTIENGLASVLDRDQMKRLREISLQARARREPDLTKLLSEEDFAPGINLTKEQKEEMQALQREFALEQRNNRGQPGGRPPGAQGGNPPDEAAKAAAEERRQKMEETRKAHMEQLLGVLTASQQSTWQGMLGAPFTGEISQRGFGGGPGGGGGRGRGAGGGGGGGRGRGAGGGGMGPGAGAGAGAGAGEAQN